MKYKYRARNQLGQMQEGYVEANSEKNALFVLQQNSLTVISLEAVRQNSLFDSLKHSWEGISAKEFVLFSRQLAVMVEAKVSLIDSIKSISEQTSNEYFKQILNDVFLDIDEGKSLSEALKKHPNVFSDLYINMIQAGEISGNLQKSLTDLADNIEKNYILTQKIKGVLYYPAFILTAFFAVGFLMISFVIPKLMTVIRDNSVRLPITTRILIATGDFMQHWWWAVLFAIIILAGGLSYYLRTEDGKKDFDIIKLKIPIISRVLRFVYLARFAENLSTLVRSGLPIVTTLQISGKVIGNSVFEAEVLEAAERVKTGGSINETFRKSQNFPPVMAQMIKVGEDTGKLDITLGTISKFYTQEADQLVSNLSSLIEPVLIIFLGVGVGVLVFSIIIPIYNITMSMR